MQVKKENDNLEFELKGEFQINQKYCFCCNKTVNLYFFLTENKLLFYYDKERKKLYLEILRNLVLAINRRFRIQEDKNKLSIYYLEKENSLIIKELKIKASHRLIMDQWLYKLNKIIKPKRVIFPTLSNNYVKSNDIFKYKDNCNFYVALCKLEYILLKNKFRFIFDIYRDLSHSIISTNSCCNEEELLMNKK